MITKVPFYANPEGQNFLDRKPLPELKRRQEMTTAQVDSFLKSEEPAILNFKPFEEQQNLQSSSGEGDKNSGLTLSTMDTPYLGHFYQVHEMSARRWDSQSIDRMDASNKSADPAKPLVTMEITHVDRVTHSGYILKSW